MKTIENREDISKLVHTFYAKIRKNELLGPIFNRHISEEQWPDHLKILTDFAFIIRIDDIHDTR